MKIELKNKTIDLEAYGREMEDVAGCPDLIGSMLMDTLEDLADCGQEIERLRKEGEESLGKYHELHQDYRNLLFNKGTR